MKQNWKENAQNRAKNRIWLRYSSNIARRIISAMSDIPGLNQTVLAKKLDVSPQYINKILKGRENLTLETISKIEKELDVSLISFPEYKHSVMTYSHVTLLDVFFATNISNCVQTTYLIPDGKPLDTGRLISMITKNSEPTSTTPSQHTLIA